MLMLGCKELRHVLRNTYVLLSCCNITIIIVFYKHLSSSVIYVFVYVIAYFLPHQLAFV